MIPFALYLHNDEIATWLYGTVPDAADLVDIVNGVRENACAPCELDLDLHESWVYLLPEPVDADVVATWLDSESHPVEYTMAKPLAAFLP